MKSFPTSMISPSPHQWSVLLRIIGQSPTSTVSPSPYHQLVHSHQCSAFPLSSHLLVHPHQCSVLPHVIRQSLLHIIGHSFSSSIVSISSHHQLVHPHHRSVPQHQSVLLHSISWFSHINSQSPHISLSHIKDQSFPHIYG